LFPSTLNIVCPLTQSVLRQVRLSSFSFFQFAALASEAAHDFAAAYFWERVGEADVVGLGAGADFASSVTFWKFRRRQRIKSPA
jgi:hypothetical protein